jgi:hypothetical protein
MSMLARSFRGVAVGKSFFSTAASPKIAIAQNIMRLKTISEAADEAALAKAVAAPLPNIDVNNLPKELDDFGPMIALGALKSGDKFVPDPKAWQNMGWMDLAQHEYSRPEVWPFVVGFM